MRFARESRPFLIGVVAAAAAAAAVLWFAGKAALLPWVLGIGLFFVVFVLFFFRDPVRKVQAAAGEIVSGADGVVRSVEQVEEKDFIKGPAVRISVFLSVFDVHVNRVPVSGTIADFRYTPGKKLFAYLEAASEYNENNSVYLEGGEVPCLVRQIVGPVARRVVCWYKPGQELAKGQRFGMMKFGSRMDVFFPEGAVEIRVTKGDRVVAGKTVIARVSGVQK